MINDIDKVVIIDYRCSSGVCLQYSIYAIPIVLGAYLTFDAD